MTYHFIRSDPRRPPRLPPRSQPSTRTQRNIPRIIPILHYPATSCRITRSSHRMFLLLLFVGSSYIKHRPPRCGHFLNSTKRAQNLDAPFEIRHDLRMTWERPRRVLCAHERYDCPIVYTRVPNFQFFYAENAEKLTGEFSGVEVFLVYSKKY